jgi:hypothetical protein
VFRRGLALEVLLVAVSCAAVFASSAAAKPPHLLPFKLCRFVMSAGDFDDGLSQMLGYHTFSVPGDTDESSTCQYASTKPDSPGVLREFPEPPAHPSSNPEVLEPSLGVECLANIPVLGSKEPPVFLPTGGCYSLVVTSVNIAVGPKVEAALRHLGPNPRNYRDKGPWPAGASRSVLHIFGAYADAEIGYATGAYDLAYGYLDVKNAQITIEEKDSPPDVPTSMLTLLKDAKHTL